MCDPVTIGLVIGGASAVNANVNANRADNAREAAARQAKVAAAKEKRTADLKQRDSRRDRLTSQTRATQSNFSASADGLFSPRSFFRG